MSYRVIPTDPLFNSQWHLLNNGQNIMGLPQDETAYRNDINVTEAWEDYTGKGVIVGVYDGGFQILHPDLAPNLLTDKFYDTLTHKLGSPIGDGHGTSTMGLILAAQNDKGGVGVAFDSRGIGYTGYGKAQNGPMTINFAEAAARMLMDGVDISSNSWGFQHADNRYITPFEFSNHKLEHLTAQLSLAQLGRDSLGTVTLFSAGNGRREYDNTIFSPTVNSPYVIAVAAANADGTVSSYSTPGPSVLVAAPASGTDPRGDANQVASIVTTDLMGSAGSNKFKDGDYTNILDSHFNSDGSYDRNASSRGFNGTSAAAPIAAGVVALILEANPNLGYRDVQEILSYSARTPDKVATWDTNGATDWNGGGHRFNNDLGFGLIDARAAVRLAETWSKQSTFGNIATETASFDGPDLVPAKSGGYQQTASFEHPLRVQHVNISISISMANSAGLLDDIKISLVGPGGKTITPVFDPSSYKPGDMMTGPLTYSFDSVQNWGEISNKGVWKLTVDNKSEYASHVDAEISVIGDRLQDGQNFIYTDEYSNLASFDASRAVLSATTIGPHTLNAAAVTGNTVIDLAQHQAIIAGVATRIGDSMQFASLITGDGNDRLTGVDTADSMTAGRGDDTLHGGGGQDTLSGGRGDDQIFGQDGNDSVLGGEGNDFGSGGFGSDTVIGGAGNDLLFGDDDSDLIDGSEGDDIVHGGTGVDTMFGSAGNDQVYGEDGADFLGAGEGHDFGSGGFGNDEVHGEGGNDLLFGDDGNDGVYGEDGDDLVYGGIGNDYLTGDAGNDRLFGEADDDGLSGGAGNDTLDGGAGADLLFGNAGDDVLTGGTGADVFAFGAGDGFDRITDFVLGGSEADVIAFNGGAFADFAAVLAASRQEEADVVIGYGAGDALTLAGVQLGALSAANFTFA